jgi:hypothetical protein
MTNFENNRQPMNPNFAILLGALIPIGLILAVGAMAQMFSTTAPVDDTSPTAVVVVSPTPHVEIEASTATPVPSLTDSVSSATATATNLPPTSTATATSTPTPSNTPSPTVTPTPTLNLAKCNSAGCGINAKPLPTIEYDYNILLSYETPVRRVCQECPPNPLLSEPELDRLVGADQATLSRLRTIALSQQPYEIAPGVVYIVFDKVHHVVVDLEGSGYILRNIIPEAERGTLITPSYCHSPNSLVVVDADYHGLNGSNKTETGRDLFFHLGRAALFERDGQFDLDVMRTREEYDPTTLSWGGGPIFIWDGEYNYNPKDEWFEEDILEYYRDTTWSKMTVALSKDRKYLFITASYDLTLEEHANNIIKLGKTWGIDVDKAMRFDGGESTYLAIRLGNYLVPVLNIDEPLIVNCLAIEKAE